MTAPLVVLCLDGCDDRVVDELAAAGRMPVLAGLAATGATVAIDTCGEVLDEAVWPTLLSGTPPGEHDATHFERFVPETMGLAFEREGMVEPFWLHLPERGRGGLVVDAPEMHPHPASAADEVCGFVKWSPAHRPKATSRRVRRTVAGRIPHDRLAEFARAPTLADERAFAERLVRRARRTGAGLAALVGGRPFVVAALSEPHAIVHVLAHHWVPDHWHRPWPPEPELVARPYEAVDAAVGEVVAAAGRAGANVVVVLAQGMRPANPVAHLLEELLVRAGLLARVGERRPQSSPLDDSSSGGDWGQRRGLATSEVANPLRFGDGAAGGRARVPVAERIRRLVPVEVRERVAVRLLPTRLQHALASRAFRDRYDWSATAVFPLPAWTVGYLRVNLAGREAAGTVPPERYRDVLAHVAALVAETTDADTGRPLVREVVVVADAYPGSKSARLPDLILLGGSDRPARRARHPELGEWSAEPRIWHFRWGEHRSGGRVLLSGPDVRAGVRIDAAGLGLAPTLCALAGCRPPSSMPGEVWRDVLG